jgi:thymidylate synthase (FAD)
MEEILGIGRENTVELIEIAGSDEDAAAAAWVSTTTEVDDEKRKRIPALIDMLMRNGHWSPFENAGWLKFKLTLDNASHIQLLRHRHQSINVESARYKEYRVDKYYIPEDWNEEWRGLLDSAAQSCFKLYHRAIEELVDSGLDRRRAKETARYFLPQCIQLECIVSMNFRAFLHFLSLRHSPDSQKEIYEIASKMRYQVEKTGRFRHCLETFDTLQK